ncbi:hypothetical protein EIN_410030 [Entamoeba invadens IP1]|uniref:Uncharacterized protein n=1 Tax=Entamoeba invadens IP1 TaxID=370355 RepID=A0A0A1TWR3_ENTIV|nr:hypothetical protein EIN_410030 [Entamoeba invadens IP1]ELP85684.1 hypothetical protein EIN_410030 [Entamoeba invadens IP1]|eukprot:XP_004185030.1 hypothetical protein EIN_410030 [Entamoeba invadens IP1]
MAMAEELLDYQYLKRRQQRVEKLSRMSGRRRSICKIEPFLVSKSPEGALKNGELIRKSDQLKKMTGDRPFAYEVDDETKNECSIKMNVLNKKFGDCENQMNSILPLIIGVCNEDAAITRGKQLRTLDKARQKMGEMD